MGQNSIRCNLSKEDIIAEIRMTLAADFEHKKGIVIVEGKDDLLFLKGKLNRSVDVQESFSGKHGVEEIVDHFSDDRVIGICDVDYDSRSPSVQMFYYDYSCLEMMLISNDTVFSSFSHVYYQGLKEPKDLRLQVLSDLEWLSLYRKLNAEQSWGVRFKGISITKAFNKSTQKIEIEGLQRQLDEINAPRLQSHRQLEMVSEAHRGEYTIEQYYLITQGHDFLYLFQAICESVKGSKGKSPDVDELFHALVCSYHYEIFLESRLYQSLLEYQSTYDISILPS